MENKDMMDLIRKAFVKWPFYGCRRMTKYLQKSGYKVNRKRISRLMKLMGLKAIYPKPNTSIPDRAHKVYPYLLRNVTVNRANQVWCTDITYIPIHKGYMYLVAIMDWYSRKVLSWRLSNTLDTGFCIEALEDALYTYPKPDILNTDQGSQFTATAFTDILKANGIKISMDGKGAWKDNVFIERLWRSLKYECVYLRDFVNGTQAQQDIRDWIQFYNAHRPHTKFGLQTPNETYTMHFDIKAVPLTATPLPYQNKQQINQKSLS